MPSPFPEEENRVWYFGGFDRTGKAWGNYEQKDGKASLTITHGTLTLNQLDLALFKGRAPKATLNGKEVEIKNLELRKGDVLALS